jgi:hypothetical protein
LSLVGHPLVPIVVFDQDNEPVVFELKLIADMYNFEFLRLEIYWFGMASSSIYLGDDSKFHFESKKEVQ